MNKEGFSAIVALSSVLSLGVAPLHCSYLSDCTKLVIKIKLPNYAATIAVAM